MRAWKRAPAEGLVDDEDDEELVNLLSGGANPLDELDHLFSESDGTVRLSVGGNVSEGRGAQVSAKSGAGGASHPRAHTTRNDAGGGAARRRDSRVQSWHETDDEEGEDFGTIDWSYYRRKSRWHDHQTQQSIADWPRAFRSIYTAYEAVQSWLALGVVGVSCGVIASVVDIGTDWATDLKFGLCRRGFWINRATCCSDSTDMESCAQWRDWAEPGLASLLFYTLVAVGMAAYSAWIATLFPYVRGSGIPEAKVILGGFAIKGFLRPWTLIAKSLGLILSVGSGLSVGKEGPFVHVCMCVGALWAPLFSKFRDNEGRKRELLSCAAGAGVAVAFGAPLGGVLFALEEVSTYFPRKTMWRSFWCAICAVLSMQWLNRNGSGKLVMFEVHYHHQWKWFEVVPFMALGIAGGLVGAAFVKMHAAALRFRASSSLLTSHPIPEVAALCFLTSLLHWGSAYLRGSSTSLLGALFADCANFPAGEVRGALCSDAEHVTTELLVAALLHLLLTAWTSTAPVPGGLLIPSLAIGGLMGRAAGLTLQKYAAASGDQGFFAQCAGVSQCITPGVYAIVGAASVLGGVTRMTVSLVVIIFEITGGLEYILPVMGAVMLSKWVGDAFTHSVYHVAIEIKGYPYLEKLEHAPTDAVARDLIPHDAPPLETLFLVRAAHSTLDIRQLLARTSCQGFPVIPAPGSARVVGYVPRVALQRMAAQGGEEVDLAPGLDAAPVQVDEATCVDRVEEMFYLLGLRYLLVTSNGGLLGIVTKKDLLRFLRKAALDTGATASPSSPAPAGFTRDDL